MLPLLLVSLLAMNPAVRADDPEVLTLELASVVSNAYVITAGTCQNYACLATVMYVHDNHSTNCRLATYSIVRPLYISPWLHGCHGIF